MPYAKLVEPGHKVKLSDYDPDDKGGTSRDDADKEVAKFNARIGELQEALYAGQHNSVLIVLQGIDTAGKDGTVSHVMAELNPTACRVESFKAPTPVELAHDFLWRVHAVTPPKGTISIFNRSHYEDVLVARVHELAPPDVIQQRYTHINNFESLLHDAGTIILKFFLYISKEEQRDRLLAREKDKDKAWKLSASDWPEHERYDAYTKAYEDALERCSTRHAPWYVVPADHKWYRNLAIAEAIVSALEPYYVQWRHDLDKRGSENLAAIAKANAGSRQLPVAGCRLPVAGCQKDGDSGAVRGD